MKEQIEYLRNKVNFYENALINCHPSMLDFYRNEEKKYREALENAESNYRINNDSLFETLGSIFKP